MKIQVGFEIKYGCVGYTPMVFMLNVHPTRSHDLLTPDAIRTIPTRSITPTSMLTDASDGKMRARTSRSASLPGSPAAAISVTPSASAG